MANLARNSAEIGDPTLVIGGTVVTGTTTVNSGTRSWTVDNAAATSFVEHQPTTTLGVTYYTRGYIYIGGAPGALMRLLQAVSIANGIPASVRLSTSRTLNLYDLLGNYVVDGAAASAPLTINQWHYIELGVMIPASGSGQAGMRLNGVQIIPMTSCNVGNSAINRFRFGKDTATATTGYFLDDYALNDSTTSSDNSWVGPIGGGLVLWEDDFERTTPKGTSPQKWGNIEEATGTGHQMQTSTAHARDGTKSLRTELRSGELTTAGHSRMMLLDFLHPTGTYPANVLRAQEGDEWYQAMSLWFEAPFPGLEGSVSWNVFFEWTSFDVDGNGPLKLVHGGANGRLAIEGKGDAFNTPPGGYYWMNDVATTTNAWHDFVFHIKFSQNPAVGFLELWHRAPGDTDYIKQNFIQGTGAPGSKIFFATLLDDEAYMKLGQYRSTSFTQTAVMFADRVKVGTTFASVAIDSSGGSGPLVTPSWVTPPTPTASSVVTGNTSIIEATTTNNSLVQKIEYIVQSTQNIINTQLVAPYDFSWDTTILPEGPMTLIAKVTQTDGQTAEITRDFIVDNIQDVNTVKVKIGGTFATKPILTKIGGTFINKPYTVFGGTGPPPTGPLTLNWLSPTSGATVSGNQTVTVSTSDDSRVDRIDFNVGSGGSGGGGGGQVYTSLSELSAAASSATPGTVLELAPGTYGTLTLSGAHAAPGITIRSQVPGGAHLTNVTFSANASGIDIQRFDIDPSSGFAVLVNSGCDRIGISYNYIHDGAYLIEYQSSQIVNGSPAGNPNIAPITNCWIRGNKLARATENAYRICNFRNCLIEENEITEIYESGSHVDGLQTIFGGDGLTYRKNYHHDTKSQQFFIKDGRANNVVIEDNLFVNNLPSPSGALNTVSFTDTLGMTVRRNTIWNARPGLVIGNWGGIGSNILVEDNVIQHMSLDQGDGTEAALAAVVTERRNTFGGTSYPGPGGTYTGGIGNMIPDRMSSTSQIVTNPAFVNTATDDYRLTTQPVPANPRGVSWKPSDFTYGAPINTINDPPWTWQWDTTTFPEGVITLKATAITSDASPNIEITRDFIVDNIGAPPVPVSEVLRQVPGFNWWTTNQVLMNGAARRNDSTTIPFVPGSSGDVAAYRVVFDETVQLEDVWISVKAYGCSWWNKTGTPDPPYGQGNGGIWNARLVPVTATGQPRFTDTQNMIGEELGIVAQTRYGEIKAAYPSIAGFTWPAAGPSGSDGPMSFQFKIRKNGVKPTVQGGTVYALCVWNSHTQPGLNYMSINPCSAREYIWPASTPGIATWPAALKTGGNGRAKSPNAIDNMDPTMPGAVWGLDPRECLMASRNGGSTFPYVGRNLGIDYPGDVEPGNIGTRIPAVIYRRAGETGTNSFVVGTKKIAGSFGSSSGSYTHPVVDRAVQLTHVWAYTLSGQAAGTITVQHKRGAVTVETATASLPDTTGGVQIGTLSSPLDLISGDHYIITCSGLVTYFDGDTNSRTWEPWRSTTPEEHMGCLPEVYTGGKGKLPITTTGLIWEDDFERTTILGTTPRKWGSIEEPTGTGHQAQTSANHAREGTRSGRFELRGGELTGGHSRMQLTDMLYPTGTYPGNWLRPKEGDDYYLGLSLWFEAPFPGLEGSSSWNVFFAWTSFDARGSGPLKIAHGGANGRLAIEGVDQDDPPGGYYWMNNAATATGGWHDLILHTKFSQNPAVGFIELWHREPSETVYTQQTFIGGGTKRFFSTLLDTEAYAKLGQYRATSFTQTALMYVDRVKLGTTYASVAAS